jgi:hypothetical protein
MTAQRPTEEIMDCSTGIQTSRELTDAEIAELEAQRLKYEAEMIEKEVEEKRISDLKTSAKAKLVAGEPLTEEEAATIVL